MGSRSEKEEKGASRPDDDVLIWDDLSGPPMSDEQLEKMREWWENEVAARFKPRPVSSQKEGDLYDQRGG